MDARVRRREGKDQVRLGESKELNSRVEQNELVLTKKQLEFPIGDEGGLGRGSDNQHVSGRHRRGPAWRDGHQRATKEQLRVHPILRSRGKEAPGACGFPVPLDVPTGPIALRTSSSLPSGVLPPRGHDFNDTVLVAEPDRALNTVLMVLIRMGVQTLSGRESVARLVDGGIRHQGPLDRLSEFVGTVTQRGKKKAKQEVHSRR